VQVRGNDILWEGGSVHGLYSKCDKHKKRGIEREIKQKWESKDGCVKPSDIFIKVFRGGKT